MKSEIQEKLEQLALEKTIPFCYPCYCEAPSGRCTKCGSDDLAKLLPGIGCDWGLDWAIKEILSTELDPVDLDEEFENFCREVYPEETQVGWMTLDTVTLMKENDPVSWRCARSDWESEEESAENIISFDNGSTYYRTHDIENLLTS